MMLAYYVSHGQTLGSSQTWLGGVYHKLDWLREVYTIQLLAHKSPVILSQRGRACDSGIPKLTQNSYTISTVNQL